MEAKRRGTLGVRAKQETEKQGGRSLTPQPGELLGEGCPHRGGLQTSPATHGSGIPANCVAAVRRSRLEDVRATRSLWWVPSTRPRWRLLAGWSS